MGKTVTHVTLPVELVNRVLNSLGERKINEAVEEYIALRAATVASANEQLAAAQEGAREA